MTVPKSRFSKWDKKTFDETLTEEAKVRAEYDDVTEKLNDMNREKRIKFEGGAVEGMAEKHLALHYEHGFLGRRLDSLRGDLDALERLRPENRLPDPMALRTHDSMRWKNYFAGKMSQGGGLRDEGLQSSEESMAEFHKLHGSDLEGWQSTQWKSPTPLFVKAPVVAATRVPLVGLVAGDAATGQESIAVQYPNWLVHRLKAFGGWGSFVRTRVTETGQDIRIMQMDPTAQMGRRLSAEGSAINDVDAPNITTLVLKAHTYTSDFIPITMEFETDTILENGGIPEMQDICLARIARLKNKELTVTTAAGAADTKPEGLVTGAKEGLTSAASRTIGFDDIVDMVYAIDPAYKEGREDPMYGFTTEEGGRIGWGMSYDALKTVTKIKDTQDNPIWLPSLRDGTPGTILGYPYQLNPNMDDVGDNTYPLVFGNGSYYMERMVNGMLFFRFWDSGTASNFSEKVVAFARLDGRYIGVKDGAVCEAIVKLKIKAQ